MTKAVISKNQWFVGNGSKSHFPIL